MKHLLNTLFVTSEDAYLALKDGDVAVYKGDRLVARIPLVSLEQILYFSYKGASPALMGKCADMGVGLSFYSPHGRYECSIFGWKNRNVLLRRSQYRLADSPEKSVEIARSFILGKVFNARWVLERAKRDHGMRIDVNRVSAKSGFLEAQLLEIQHAASCDELRGIEGLCAKAYFSVFDEMILRDKKNFFFAVRSRRPPMDRMNALLSFIYVLLSSDCIAALHGVGLDPYVGYLHTDRPGKPSLALDLMEELRACFADRLALSLVNTGDVTAKDFTEQEDGSVLLSDQGRKKVLVAWQKRKGQRITHPFLGEKMEWGLVPYVQALLVARYIRGDVDAYPPFFWK